MKRVLLLALVSLLLVSVGYTVAAPTEPSTVYLPIALHTARLDLALGPCGYSHHPEVYGPRNGSVGISLAPALSWERPSRSSVSYLPEVAADPAFAQKLPFFKYDETDAIGFYFNLQPGTTYYWRFLMECTRGTGPYSPTLTFTTLTDPEFLPPPTLKLPENNITLYAWQCTFSWTPVEGAWAYLVRYRPVGATEYTYHFVSRTETEYFSGYSAFQPRTTYEWSIATKSRYGYGEFSETRYFTTY